jgi:lipoprotein-releasing system permease protein
LYNEVKPSEENQPLGLSEDYKRKEFIQVHKTKKDRGKSIYTSVSIIGLSRTNVLSTRKVTASVLLSGGRKLVL